MHLDMGTSGQMLKLCCSNPQNSTISYWHKMRLAANTQLVFVMPTSHIVKDLASCWRAHHLPTATHEELVDTHRIEGQKVSMGHLPCREGIFCKTWCKHGTCPTCGLTPRKEAVC